MAYWRVRQGAALEIGDNSRFSFGSIDIFAGASLKVGKRSSIGERYIIVASCCTEISVGDDCLFSWDIGMLSSDGHSIFDISTGKNISYSKNRKIEIGNHVWVGMRVVLLYNTKICDGCVIGVNSLVKGAIPNNCIAAGTPAKVVRKNIAWCEENNAGNIMECGREYIALTGER